MAIAIGPDRGTLTKPSEAASLENTLMPMEVPPHLANLKNRGTEALVGPISDTDHIEGQAKGSIGSTVNLISHSEMQLL